MCIITIGVFLLICMISLFFCRDKQLQSKKQKREIEMKQHLQKSLAALSLKKLTSDSVPKQNNNKMKNDDNNIDIRTKGESVSINLQKRSNINALNAHVDKIEQHSNEDEGEIDYLNIDHDTELRYTDDEDADDDINDDDESEAKTTHRLATNTILVRMTRDLPSCVIE